MQIENDSIDIYALSRQLAVIGKSTQLKLMALRIFIHGLSGVGIEVAKNIIMMGPKSVTIYDPQPITVLDLGCNFYCHEDHVNKTSRAQACLPQLRRLNKKVQVNIANSQQIDEIASNCDCVVILDCFDREYLISLNQKIREKRKGFLYGGSLGLYGFAFVDFGKNHLIQDATAQEPKECFIANITNDTKGCVSTYEKHRLNDGDIVAIKQVQGMEGINNKSFKVEVKDLQTFCIGDLSHYGAYITGGMAIQQKATSVSNFQSLESSLEKEAKKNQEPQDEARQLYIFLNGLFRFYQRNHRLPGVLNYQDSQQLQQLIAEQIPTKEQKISYDRKVIEDLSLYAGTQIAPCTSFWGGFISSEIIKITGKFTPLNQWQHLYFSDLQPDTVFPLPDNHDRYFSYRCIFGDQLHQRLMNSTILQAGAGSIGCQSLKIFALMGCGCQAGSVRLIDNQKVKRSNLTNQFMFCMEDLSKYKVEAAERQAKRINSSINIRLSTVSLDRSSQQLYDDQFWEGVDIVVNAVDSRSAKSYIDSRCVWYEKPLFDYSMQGLKGQTKVVLPYLTKSLTDEQSDYQHEPISLKNNFHFPYTANHTIRWALFQLFNPYFVQMSNLIAQFYQDRQKCLSKLRRQKHSFFLPALKQLKEIYLCNLAKDYKVCVKLALRLFSQVFSKDIKKLLRNFPANKIDMYSGNLFWSGLKRVPHEIELDVSDPLHIKMIHSSANLYAIFFNLPTKASHNDVVCLACEVLSQTKDNCNLQEEKAQESDEEEEAARRKLKEDFELAILQSYQLDEKQRPSIMELNVEEPQNYQLQFLQAATRLRARNYNIREADTLTVMRSVSKMTPSLVSIASTLAGLSALEVIKYFQRKKLARFKNVDMQLATPCLMFSQPEPPILIVDQEFDVIMCGPSKALPKRTNIADQAFSKWQKVEIKGPMTLGQLKKSLEQQYRMQIQMIITGQQVLYSYFSKRQRERLGMQVADAVELVAKGTISKGTNFVKLAIAGSRPEGVEINFADIRFHL